MADGPPIFEAPQGDGVVGVTARAADGTVLGTIGAQEPSRRRPRSSADAQALGNPIGFAPFAE